MGRRHSSSDQRYGLGVLGVVRVCAGERVLPSLSEQYSIAILR